MQRINDWYQNVSDGVIYQQIQLLEGHIAWTPGIRNTAKA